MSSEREAILQALQQHLLDAAEQLGKLIEVEQSGDAQLKICPTGAQAQVPSVGLSGPNALISGASFNPPVSEDDMNKVCRLVSIFIG